MAAREGGILDDRCSGRGGVCMLEGNDGKWRNISDRSSPAERRMILLFGRGWVPLRSGGVVR